MYEGQAIDLMAAATALPEKYKLVGHLIRQTCDANSICTDLSTALDMVETLIAMLPGAGNDPDGKPNRASNCALALINTAVILYARATKTSSDHRRSFDFRSQFTPEERQVHKRLCDLRDKAIAHFGPGDSYGGPPWQIEALYIPLDRPNDLKIMMASRRLIKQREFQIVLREQIKCALALATAEAQKRNGLLVEELNKNVGDERLVELLHEHRVNLLQFFETQEVHSLAMDGDRSGRRSGVVDH